MNFLTWGRNPWGQQVLTHVSWDLLWASLFAGLMFLVAHGSYMILSYRKRSSSETDALEAANNVVLGRVSDRLGPLAPIRAGLVASAVVAALLTWPDNGYVVALLVVCAGLAFGTFLGSSSARFA